MVIKAPSSLVQAGAFSIASYRGKWLVESKRAPAWLLLLLTATSRRWHVPESPDKLPLP
jgi:hypothetical protein